MEKKSIVAKISDSDFALKMGAAIKISTYFAMLWKISLHTTKSAQKFWIVSHSNKIIIITASQMNFRTPLINFRQETMPIPNEAVGEKIWWYWWDAFCVVWVWFGHADEKISFSRHRCRIDMSFGYVRALITDNNISKARPRRRCWRGDMLTLVRCIFVLCEVCNGGVDVKFLSHATDVGLSRALDISEPKGGNTLCESIGKWICLEWYKWLLC